MTKDFFPKPEQPNIWINQAYYALIQPDETTTRYMDLMGRFYKRSSYGNEYILVRYHYNANYILVSPIKNRKGSTIVDAWQSLYNTFKKLRVVPSTYVLDNEISKDLINDFEQ